MPKGVYPRKPRAKQEMNCRECGCPLDATTTYPNNLVDGRRICRACHYRYSTKHRALDIEKRRRQNRESYARNKDRWRPTRLAYYDRTCDRRRERRKKWATPDVRARHNHRRYAMASNAFVEDVSISVLYARDDGRCGICTHFVALDDASIDHVVPYARGGEHSYGNTRLAHRWCNISRNDRFDNELGAAVYTRLSERWPGWNGGGVEHQHKLSDSDKAAIRAALLIRTSPQFLAAQYAVSMATIYAVKKSGGGQYPPRQRLSDKDEADILAALRDGIKGRDLAARYGVSTALISRVKHSAE